MYRFNIPAKVPPIGEISYHDLAQACGIEESVLRRVVRFAIVHHHIFHEKREGYVSHSAASELLADSEDAISGVGLMFDATYQGFARVSRLMSHQGDT